MRRLVIILLNIFLFSGIAYGAYVPPIGIPNPDFGGSVGSPIDAVRPSRPAGWDTDTEVPGYYYCDPSGSSMAWGTPTRPKSSLPTTIAAGSYVEVHGTWTASTWSVLCNGTNDAWVANTSGLVWIVGYSDETKPSFSKSCFFKGTYAIIEKIKAVYISGTSLGKLQIGSATQTYETQYICLRDCEASGDLSLEGGGIITSGNIDYSTHHAVIYNCYVHDLSDWDPHGANDDDSAGITAGVYSNNIWILNNTVTHTSGSGIHSSAVAPSTLTHHIYIGFNTVWETRQAGIAFKYSTDMIVSQNHIYNIWERAPDYSEGSPSKGIGFQYDPQNLWIIYNKIHGCGYGIFSGSFDGSSTAKIYIIGNLIYDIDNIDVNEEEMWWTTATNYSCMSDYSVRERYVINNTCADVIGGIISQSGCISPPCGLTLAIENNIIYERSNANTSDIEVQKSLDPIIRNNLVYSTVGQKFRLTSDIYTDLSFENGTTYDGNIIQDPLLVNPPINLNIQTGSPAKDTGLASASLTVDVYQLFFDTYGIDIKKDYAGLTRPINTDWDIGAYEYIGTPYVPFYGITSGGATFR